MQYSDLKPVCSWLNIVECRLNVRYQSAAWSRRRFSRAVPEPGAAGAGHDLAASCQCEDTIAIISPRVRTARVFVFSYFSSISFKSCEGRHSKRRKTCASPCGCPHRLASTALRPPVVVHCVCSCPSGMNTQPTFHSLDEPIQRMIQIRFCCCWVYWFFVAGVIMSPIELELSASGPGFST